MNIIYIRNILNKFISLISSVYYLYNISHLFTLGLTTLKFSNIISKSLKSSWHSWDKVFARLHGVSYIARNIYEIVIYETRRTVAKDKR